LGRPDLAHVAVQRHLVHLPGLTARVQHAGRAPGDALGVVEILDQNPERPAGQVYRHTATSTRSTTPASARAARTTSVTAIDSPGRWASSSVPGPNTTASEPAISTKLCASVHAGISIGSAPPSASESSAPMGEGLDENGPSTSPSSIRPPIAATLASRACANAAASPPGATRPCISSQASSGETFIAP